jgi:hypothetical protein
MILGRIVAGSIVALLLSVCSLSAACDVSCAFGSMKSDCHSDQTESPDKMPGGMTMIGMAMAGMAMRDMPNSDDPPAASAISRAKTTHPSIGEMGPCERQSCDNGSAVTAQANRFGLSHFHSIVAVTETSRHDDAMLLFHDARDSIATHRARDGSPAHPSLRI